MGCSDSRTWCHVLGDVIMMGVSMSHHVICWVVLLEKILLDKLNITQQNHSKLPKNKSFPFSISLLWLKIVETQVNFCYWCCRLKSAVWKLLKCIWGRRLRFIKAHGGCVPLIPAVVLNIVVIGNQGRASAMIALNPITGQDLISVNYHQQNLPGVLQPWYWKPGLFLLLHLTLFSHHNVLQLQHLASSIY